MKRFYCTECKKMKRVRKYPIVIENADAVDPISRKGVCNRHAENDVEPASYARVVNSRRGAR